MGSLVWTVIVLAAVGVRYFVPADSWQDGYHSKAEAVATWRRRQASQPDPAALDTLGWRLWRWDGTTVCQIAPNVAKTEPADA